MLRGHRLELRLADVMLGIDTDAPVDAERPLALSSRSHPHVAVSGATSKRRRCSTRARASRSSTPMARLAACEAGGRRFDASPAVILPIRGIQRAGDPEFDLILGMPVIGQADWIIDLALDVWGFRGPSR